MSHSIYGPVVEWLRRRSHTAKTRGSIPRGPIPYPFFFAKEKGLRVPPQKEKISEIKIRLISVKIILQFPEGLKREALAQAEKYESEGHEVFVSSAPCYGACDVCLDEAKAVGAQKIVHFGHAEFMKIKSDIEIEYVPYEQKIEGGILQSTLSSAISELNAHKLKKIGLVTTVQHLGQFAQIKSMLESAGFEVIVEKGAAHVRHPGQILGCDSIAAQRASKKADAILYFGGGRFHPLGIPADKPVLCADPFQGNAYWITDDIVKLQKRKKGALLAASQAKRFGILVCTKIGQMNLPGAKLAKKKLEERGRTAVLLVANEINPRALDDFNSFDAYISTACPRIGDDHDLYSKPILDLSDLPRLLELL